VGNDGSSLRIKIKFDRNKSITSIKKESDKNEVPSKKNGKWNDSKSNRKKTNNKGRPKSRRKSTRKQKSKRQLSETSEQNEELSLIYANYSNNLWKTIEEYFNPIPEVEIELCEPENCRELKDDDRYLVIPKRGKHYIDVWEEEDKLVDDKELGIKNVKNRTDLIPEIHCQDITARILSALVEDGGVSNGKKSKDTNNMMGEVTAIVCDTSLDILNNVEQRLRNELKELLILSDTMEIPITTTTTTPQINTRNNNNIVQEDDENDEISKELRSLQQQLREYNKINCQKKRQLYPELIKLREEQIKEQKKKRRYV